MTGAFRSSGKSFEQSGKGTLEQRPLAADWRNSNFTGTKRISRSQTTINYVSNSTLQKLRRKGFYSERAEPAWEMPTLLRHGRSPALSLT